MKLGVVTAYHNEVEIIDEVIMSIAQIKSPFDFYLVDDCSTYQPQSVIAKYQQEPWFHYLRNDTNMGPSASLNRGIKAALDNGAALIAINDADDISYKNRFQPQITAFEEDADLMIIGGGADMVDYETGRILWQCYHPQTNMEIHRLNKVNATFVHSTVMYRASIFDRLGFYREDVYALDYEMVSRVLNAGCKAANLPELVLRYNIRPNSMSVMKRRRQVASRISVQLRYFQPLDWHTYWGLFRSLFAFVMPGNAASQTKALLHQLKTNPTAEKGRQ